MRLLTILAFLAAALWAGWWFIGSTAAERGALAGIDAARSNGWTVELDDLSVAGFPNRFDTRIGTPRIETPDGSWSASMARLDVMALSYKPNEVIVVPDPRIALGTPVGPFEIVADDLRASAAVSLSAQPDLTKATLAGDAVQVDGAGLQTKIGAALLAMREGGEPLSYDVAIDLSDIAISGLDPILPDDITRTDLDATLLLDRPAQDGARLAGVTLRRAGIAWDEVRITLDGALTIGADGFPMGELVLGLRGWRDLLPLAQAAGVPPGQLTLLAGGIAGMEQDGQADVPLSLRQGQLWFGAIPLGRLPRLPAPYNP